MSADTPSQQPAPATPGLAMIMTLGLISLVAGFSVTLAYQWTKPYVAENQRISTERAVAAVLPGAAKQRGFRMGDAGPTPVEPANDPGDGIYVGYDQQGKIIGIAGRGASQGYAGLVYVMYAYRPECRCITAMRVVKMNETPGLGDKVLKDKNFLKNFEALEARLDEGGNAMAHRIQTVKNGTKQEAWQIDAISGSTVTSKAIGRALDESTQKMVPFVHRYLTELERAGQ